MQVQKSYNKSITPLIFIMILLLVFLTGNLIAQENQENKENQEKKETTEAKKTQEPYELRDFVDEIVVKGEIIEETATVNTVTAEEIEEKGVKSVAEALELIPGAHVRVGGKGEAYVRIRGFNQREVAVLIDGIPVSSPYDGNLDLSSIPVDAVERIEVVKGAASLLYGANAMGGVVNIITKRSDGSTKISLRGEYGSGESKEFGALFQGSFSPKVRYMITGIFEDNAYYPLSADYGTFANQGPGDRLNSDRQRWSGRASLGFDYGKNGQASINFSHLDQVRGLPHHESDSKAKFWRFDDWRLGNLDFVLQNKIGNFSYKTKIYYQYYANVLDGYDDITYTTMDGKYAFSSSYDDKAFGGDLFFRLATGSKHLLKMALRYRKDMHREQDDVGEPWIDYRMHMLSVPLEGEWKPGHLFSFIYGASFDVMVFDTEDVQGRETHTTTAVNPQVALLFHPSLNWEFRLSASRKTRFPTLRELFSSTSGNPDLEPMKSNSLEAGFEYRPNPRLILSGAVFYNDVIDLINRLDKYDPYINIDHAVFKGFETGIQWVFLSRAQLVLNYTHLIAQDKTHDTNQFIEHRPKHKLDADLQITLPARFRLNFFGSYVSEQFYYDGDTEFTLEPYTLVDIKLSKNFGDHLSIYLKLNNLFDVNYYESEGYPREGRMFYFGVRYVISKQKAQ